jgi:hypothetical protein
MGEDKTAPQNAEEVDIESKVGETSDSDGDIVAPGLAVEDGITEDVVEDAVEDLEDNEEDEEEDD